MAKKAKSKTAAGTKPKSSKGRARAGKKTATAPQLADTGFTDPAAVQGADMPPEPAAPAVQDEPGPRVGVRNYGSKKPHYAKVSDQQIGSRRVVTCPDCDRETVTAAKGTCRCSHCRKVLRLPEYRDGRS